MRWLILFLCLAAPVFATETEIVLEEGNAEIELSNGVFVAMSAGADVRIVHRDDGAPEMIKLRRGSVQIISTFGDPSDMSLRVGGSVMTLGRGAAIFSVTPEGGMEAIMMNGAPIKNRRDDQGGRDRQGRKKGGEAKDGKSGHKERKRKTSFGKKPKKRDRTDTGGANTRSVGEDAGIDGPLPVKKSGPQPKAGPKMLRPRSKAPRQAKPPPPPPQSPDAATREMSDRAKTKIEEQRPPPPPQPPRQDPPQPNPPGQPPGPNPPGPNPPGPNPPGPNSPGPNPPGPNPPGPNPPSPPREPGQ